MALVKINSENFEEEVMSSDIPVIIDCWAPWCAPCQLMGPVFEELSNEYDGKLKFGKLNVDEEPLIAARYGISGIPTLLIIHNGEEVSRIVGFAPKEIMKQKIDSVLEKI